MAADGLSDAQVRTVLSATRRVALVGASNRAERPSFGVMAWLLARGYDVTPVNPGLAGQAIQGCHVVATLDEAAPLDMVDVFRNSDAASAVVDEVLALPWRPKVIWMQLGVVNPPAAERAKAAGLTVVMDRCPVIEAGRLRV